MNPNELDATSTVADESCALVDDEDVISKTLPSAPASIDAERVKAQLDRAVRVTRDFAIDQPLQAMLIAAAGGAALTALLLILMRRERI